MKPVSCGEMRTCPMLKSFMPNVHDLPLDFDGRTLFIGRNKLCNIRDVQCSRQKIQVQWKWIGDQFFEAEAVDLKTRKRWKLTDGSKLIGPGFEYQLILGDGEKKSETKKMKNFDNSETEIKCEEFKDEGVFVLKYLDGGEASEKLAAFDFDLTLVATKSKATFPKNGDDWKLLEPSVNKLIKKFVIDEGFRFVVFTNQKGVSTGSVKIEDVKQRVVGCLRQIGLPCLVLMALEDNLYRKPRPGMFKMVENRFNDGIKFDRQKSFYVGDAAGRTSALNKDHSCADLLFALNLGLPFLTPEQFYANRPPKDPSTLSTITHKLPVFKPKSLIGLKIPFAHELTQNSSLLTIDDLMSRINKITADASHVILMSGLPASGKSTFYRTHLESRGYHHINRDFLGTMDKCEASFKRLSTQKNVKIVIDNINHNRQSRSRWCQLTREAKFPIIAFSFDVTKDHAIHNNVYRRICDRSSGKSNQNLPDWLLYKHIKESQPISKDEGFAAIFKINFQVNFNINDLEADEIHPSNLYFMYLVEK